MSKPRKANGHGEEAWWYINPSTIDVYRAAGFGGVRLTRTQLEYALTVMRGVKEKP